ncbi:MAG: hypothetical protein HYV94_10790 [Candidatus Rokubacteria bacterium]|nr:hypothetical protein [Candidatus Rokubacteria bacterium]
MKHEEFRIGIEFWCGGRRWRCTDVGTRTVVGICLEPHEVVSVTGDVEADVEAGGITTRTITTDDSWLAGPPYAVVEEVFDEHSIEDCTLSPDVDDD